MVFHKLNMSLTSGARGEEDAGSGIGVRTMRTEAGSVLLTALQELGPARVLAPQLHLHIVQTASIAWRGVW
jgi:hypothetical protein